jgi:predicted transcriptional regulator of viral defense system
MRRQSVDACTRTENVGTVGSMEYQNGNQKRVHRAIGNHAGVTVEGLVHETGLDEQAVRNAVKRLLDAGEIRRMTLGGYAIVNKRCLLSEVW